MPAQNSDIDYWTNLEQIPENISQGTSALSVTQIEFVEPLDMQIGEATPRSIPADLYETFFGKEASPNGLEVSTPNTFAILDGAKLPGLAEILEASGLEYACLFQGKAAEELRDVAPWIIRLSEDNSFTRRLFTVGETPWTLWSKDGGIFLRSTLSLEDLRRHFRRFTRVQDMSGAWFYLRFYEPQLTCDYMQAIASNAERLDQWLRPASGGQIDVITLTGPTRDWPGPRTATCFRLKLGTEHAKRNSPFRIDTLELDVFARHRRDDFFRRLDAHIASEVPEFAAQESSARMAQIQDAVSLAERYGVTLEKAVADVALAATLNPLKLTEDPRSLRFLETDMHPLDKGAQLLEHARAFRSKKRPSI